MPRYFFNRIDGVRDIDQDGVDLPDFSHAKHEAITFAADTLKHDSHKLWNGGEVRIEVVDSDLTLVFAILISVVETVEELSLIEI